MNALPKEIVQEIIKSNNFQNPGEVLSFLKDAFKDVLQELLEAEMDAKLGYSRDEVPKKNIENSRNGYSSKTVRSELGPVKLDIPRDRKGEFEPRIVPKYKRDVSGIEEKVISLYARGMSTRDIHDQIKDLYGVELSADMVSRITERIIPEIKEWQNRPLEPVYPFVFMDAIHYKIREDKVTGSHTQNLFQTPIMCINFALTVEYLLTITGLSKFQYCDIFYQHG